ncbi:MAG: hypothetical protein IJX78_05495 [Bacilli bacterium]|nr:hypothetical protein [Bacilli bacterium]
MKISKISLLHYIKLICRSILLLSATAVYLYFKITKKEFSIGELELTIVFAIIWFIYFLEMIIRFFPSNLESMGCQKQFEKNFIPNNKQKENFFKKKPNTTILVFISWIILNGIIGILYFTKVFDKGILLLISFAYGVCDMICILFFCPFQTWIMKNKCCTTCRIYNWDFAMMFTPLLFIPSLYTYSLVILSLMLLLKWEIYYKKYPERFSEETNCALHCENCKEKLCHHKKQLRSFMKKQIAKAKKIIKKENIKD